MRYLLSYPVWKLVSLKNLLLFIIRRLLLKIEIIDNYNIYNIYKNYNIYKEIIFIKAKNFNI